ncbi:MAG TPA: toxin-antitoxin system HicB family antitoxin [Acidimicrobiia bacterium]|nr:toxin-antitoxin system HicB family antitoxin [Acidimicrobiia bacterium]
MDTSIAMTRLAAAIEQQVVLAGADAETEELARAMLAAAEPAVRQIAFDLAEQAAVEVASQLPGHEVHVVLSEGEPALQVRQTGDDPATVAGESLDARITLRLPPSLKEIVESAAEERGESVNTWLVKALSSKAQATRKVSGRRVTGTIET